MADGGGAGRLYLGLDSSTQSLSAIVIEVDGHAARVALETSIPFDEALPQYGTRHGVLPSPEPGVAVSSPVMWAEAMDLMMGRLAASGLDLSRLAAISGSAQQHGSVYLSPGSNWALDTSRLLAPQVGERLSRAVAPIWMDSSTSVECAEITAAVGTAVGGGAVGGAAALAARTGSRAFERFTGPQIRKFAKTDPAAYARTGRIHLVSSFLASVLAGCDAPVDPGDGSGANLMDLEAGRWWPVAVEATAPGLAAKLPAIAPSTTIVGPLSPYWQTRHRLPPARVVVWSGDNPCSLIGVGLVREGRVAISLGTSDTIFGPMDAPRADARGIAEAGGTGHVFGAPTGRFMGLTCFSNGSLARERVRDAFGLTWDGFSRALGAAPPGNAGRLMLPWFEPEITPPVLQPGVHRVGLAEDDVAGNVRGVVEAQQMAMAIHSQWMGVNIDTIFATGGASVNEGILQVMADVFGAEVYRSTVGNSAALGAALCAWRADALADGRELSWDEVTAVARPASASRVGPDSARQAVYRGLMPIYAQAEAQALHGRTVSHRNS
jgi:xylulokinase